jgi:hypothetical protein
VELGYGQAHISKIQTDLKTEEETNYGKNGVVKRAWQEMSFYG